MNNIECKKEAESIHIKQSWLDKFTVITNFITSPAIMQLSHIESDLDEYLLIINNFYFNKTEIAYSSLSLIIYTPLACFICPPLLLLLLLTIIDLILKEKSNHHLPLFFLQFSCSFAVSNNNSIKVNLLSNKPFILIITLMNIYFLSSLTWIFIVKTSPITTHLVKQLFTGNNCIYV